MQRGVSGHEVTGAFNRNVNDMLETLCRNGIHESGSGITDELEVYNSIDYDHDSIVDANVTRINSNCDPILGRGLSGTEWEGGNPSVEQYWEGIHDFSLDERVKESAGGMRTCKNDGETKQVQIDD